MLGKSADENRTGQEKREMIPIRNAVPSRYPAVITWILIVINCSVFLYQNSLSPDELELFLREFALIPARYTDIASLDSDVASGSFFPLASMMFLHGGWLHLILNMWMLWLFGATIEDRLGHARSLMFYLACGLGASITHAIFNPTSTISALGASGAIAGILGCYLRLFPLGRPVVIVPILIIPLFVEVHAFIFIGIWFLFQLVQSALESHAPSAEDVAWRAPMSEAPWRALRSGRSWFVPSSATALTMQMKASSASIPAGGYDVSIGG
jgi:membrane associated rhomboid family serine protease